ncbi:MAG: hypothetical protein LBQ98_09735 [Nitrososphaerota archaeon]|nr:hypothetical protein [Nitrososphaerota archaeon]
MCKLYGNKKEEKTHTSTKKQSRLTRAKVWLPTYNGMHVVKAYRKKFHVNTPCAVRELLEIGYEFKPGYVDNLLKEEALRCEQLRKKKAEAEAERLSKKYYDWQDDTFYYIAGYTSGGVPFGITWKEMGLKPYDNNDENDCEERECKNNNNGK